MRYAQADKSLQGIRASFEMQHSSQPLEMRSQNSYV